MPVHWTAVSNTVPTTSTGKKNKMCIRDRTSEGSGSMSEFKRDRKDYHMVGKCVPKKDSNQLLLGKPDVYKRQQRDRAVQK